MVKRESGCVSCGLPCLGRACPHYEEITLVCDKCGHSVDDLYEYDGGQVCEECLINNFTKVDVENECFSSV